MAKYNVDHACGHSATHNLIGPQRDRDRRLEWLAGTVCSDCYHQERDEARAAASETAAAANAAAGLPELTGSEKQIAWAESIRRPICEALAAAEASLTLDPELSAAGEQEMRDGVTLVVDEIRQQAEARWWIDHRDDIARSVSSAAHWIASEVQRRGLAPTAMAESQTIVTRRAERRAELVGRQRRRYSAKRAQQIGDLQRSYDRVTARMLRLGWI